LTSFPALDFDAGLTFGRAWRDCTNLATFPAHLFDNCLAIDFGNAWMNCALTQQSVDNILVSLDTAGQSNGSVRTSGGTSAAPGTAGQAAVSSLVAKGWVVVTN
jgi:hypothetical protein